MASLGSEDFVMIMSAWGIKRAYRAENEEKAREMLYKALKEGVSVLIVEEKYFDVIYPEIKVIRSENPERTFIVSFIPGPGKGPKKDPISGLMKEAIGFEIGRG